MSCAACGKSGDAIAYCTSQYCARPPINNFSYSSSSYSGSSGGGGGGGGGGGSGDVHPLAGLMVFASPVAIWAMVHPPSFFNVLAKVTVTAAGAAAVAGAVYGVYRGIKYNFDRHGESRYNALKAKLFLGSMFSTAAVDLYTRMPLGTTITTAAVAGVTYKLGEWLLDYKYPTQSNKLFAAFAAAAMTTATVGGYIGYTANKYPSTEIYLDQKSNFRSGKSYIPIFEKWSKPDECSSTTTETCRKIASIPYGKPACVAIDKSNGYMATIFGMNGPRILVDSNIFCNTSEMDTRVAEIRLENRKLIMPFLLRLMEESAKNTQQKNNGIGATEPVKKTTPAKPEKSSVEFGSKIIESANPTEPKIPEKVIAATPAPTPTKPIIVAPVTSAEEKLDLDDFKRIATAGHSHFVTTESLNIRAKPSAQSEILGQTSRTSCLIVFGKAGGSFLPVYGRTPDGNVFSGYAHRDYLRKTDLNKATNCGAAFDPAP